MTSTTTRPAIKQHPTVYQNVLELIGDTPLVELPIGREAPRAVVWGKLESMNPGGSVKDRICLAIIEQAERDGTLAPGGVVVEPTSGNTGIGLALVCRNRGYRCILTMPESMSLERRALLELMGAELVLTPAEKQMKGAIERALEIQSDLGAFVPRQFDNPVNPEVHETTTAREILHAFGDLHLDAFVAGIGTGGTVSGVGRVLRRERPDCRVVGVEPESCATISKGEVGPTKIQGLAAGFIPGNFDKAVPHEVLTVSDRDAYRTKFELSRAGILVGISAGAAVHAALRVARELPPTANVVVILPDTGERYFSLDEYFES
jgi:cysteine synthase